MQRSQVEELLQSVSRSRDENVVADVEAAIRVALQQSALTGSAEPLVATLKQADERLARYNQPRLERVRRAVQSRSRSRQGARRDRRRRLTLRLDEAVRLVDELPLLAQAAPRRKAGRQRGRPGAGPQRRPAPAGDGEDWRARAAAVVAGRQRARRRRDPLAGARHAHRPPEAMLVAPEQQFFVRENLKLRLLNARLALLSRQFEIAQSDLREAQAALERYFDRGSKRVVTASATCCARSSAQCAPERSLPRPDETLAALAAAAAGR